ncbi:hypothetical protein [Nocardioides pyridinolyticus]
MATEPDSKWITHAEAAAIVGCSRTTIDRAQAAGRIARRSREFGPPKDGDVWFDTRTAALVIGCTPQHMARLARTGRIPASTNGGRKRFWFKRHHVEQYAAARALWSRFDHKAPA